MPAYPEVAGSVSGNFWVRYQTGVCLGSAEQRTHSADTRLAVKSLYARIRGPTWAQVDGHD